MRKLFNYIIVFTVSLISFVVLIINYFNISYPVKYLETVNKYSSIYNLEPVLVLSIINVESNFKQDAVSISNAIGLMQLKLSTAQDMSNLCNDGEVNTEILCDYEYNIKYGCMYLNYLFNYYDNNFDNAICAYNAGLGNVNLWLNDNQYLDSDGNLINIPYEETRNYLIKIKRNLKIYSHYQKIGKLNF